MTWKDRLKKASWNGFTDDDREAASSWNSCAVGELKSIQRDLQGRPDDSILFNLGQAFDAAVYNRDRRQARKLYVAIHKQVRKLKLRVT